MIRFLRLYTLKFWLGGLCVLTCADAQSQTTPTAALTLKLPALPGGGGVKTLPAQEITITTTTERCGSSAFEMPGQGWDVGLTTGGISLWGSTNGAVAAAPTLQTLYNLQPEQLDTTAQDVRLLILDHYVPVRLLLRETPQSSPTEVEVVHGALVEAHLRAILESAGFEYRPGPRRGQLTYQRGERFIRLERVALDSPALKAKGDVPGPTSGQQIRLTLQTNPSFKEALLGSKDVTAMPISTVLNMSFSMLPCALMTDYRARRDLHAAGPFPSRYTLNEYLRELATLNQLSVNELQRQVTEVPTDEPLMKYLSETLSERQNRRVLAVASSGNYGLGFSTAPGAAPQVISVGATTWDAAPLNWSDVADVSAVGEWYRLSSEQLTRYCQEGETCVTPDILTRPARYQDFAYRGTSFAAPTISAYLALSVSRDNPCFDLSPLGFQPLQKGKSGAVGIETILNPCAPASGATQP